MTKFSIIAQSRFCIKESNSEYVLSNEIVKLTTNDTTQILTTDTLGVLTISNNLISPNTFIEVEGYEKHKIEKQNLNTNPVKISLNPLHLLSEIVITGQYSETSSQKSIYTTKVISSEQISQMAAINLTDVLKNNTGFRINQDQILGSNMSLQGLSGSNVKILIDGIPVIGRLDGNIDLSQINVQNIERIEIIEGPLAVQYGTDAMAGTINLISKKNILKKNIKLTTHYESVGNYNVLSSAQLPFKKSDVSVALGRLYFDGWSNNEPMFNYSYKILANNDRNTTWKPKLQYMADLSYNLNFKKTKLNYKSSWFWEEIINRGKPLAPYSEYAFDDYYRTQRINQLFQSSTKISKYKTLTTQLAYNYYKRNKNTYYTDLTSLNKTLSKDYSAQDTAVFDLANLRANYIYQNDSSAVNYELGLDLKQETTLGKRILNKNQAFQDYAIYTSSTINLLKTILIKPALRISYNSSYATPLIPSLHVKKQFKNNVVTRLSYARGFRAPTLKEMYFTFYDINHNIQGNTNLKSENGNNFSVAIEKTFYLKKSQSLVLSANSFYNQIHNLITLAQHEDNSYQYINIGHFRSKGISLHIKYLFKNLELQNTFNYTGSKEFNTKSETNLVPYYFTGDNSLSTTYSFRKLNSKISIFYKLNGKVKKYSIDSDQDINTYFTAPHQLLDLNITKTFFNKKLELSFGVKNITNTTSITSSVSTSAHSGSSDGKTLIANGRNYFIKLIWNIL
ncbi:MAG: TonB-dependent receptor [Cytophagales bacterium]